MDHSYRANQDGNGNGRPNRPGFFQPPTVDALTTTNGASKSIYAFVDDLFFLAKIQETARKLNVKVEFVKPEKEVLDMIVNLEEKPALIIFDLNSVSAKPLTVIPKLKAKLKKATSIIGFLSHLQGELKMKAIEVGCDMVLPRSAFSQNLPQLLKRHASSDVVEQEEGQGQ
jgi:CheY-like chemotaxis protein